MQLSNTGLAQLAALAASDIISFVETLEHHHIARLALFAGWIWLGWTLAT